MKPELTMSSNKDSIPDGPVVITQMASSTAEPRQRNTKKYLIIGGSVVVVIAIVLTAILVGMYFFTKAQTDLIKYSLNVDKETKQDVAVDSDDNSVEYHSYNDQYETWTVDDFNKDIQTMKVKTSMGINCYISPLNRTSALDPSKIRTVPNLPSDTSKTSALKLNYIISGTPVADTSFLGKKARDACKGSSVYWIYPECSDSGTDGQQRNKRCVYDCYARRSYPCTVNGQSGYICTDYDCYLRSC